MKHVFENILINRVSMSISRSEVFVVLNVVENNDQEFEIHFEDKSNGRGDSPLVFNFKQLMSLYTDRKVVTIKQQLDGVTIFDTAAFNSLIFKGITLTYNQKEIERNA